MRLRVMPDTLRLQRMEAKITSLQERVVRATELFCDGQIAKAGYDALCAKASEESDAAQIQLARLHSTRPKPALPPLDAVLKAARTWATCFSSAETTAHRDVLATLVDRVVPVRIGFGRYRVDITWTTLGAALQQTIGALSAA